MFNRKFKKQIYDTTLVVLLLFEFFIIFFRALKPKNHKTLVDMTLPESATDF